MTEIIASEEKPLQVLSDIYDSMITFENLYNCHLQARAKKRYRPEIMRFTDRLEDNLFSIQEDLKNGTYEVGTYRRFFVWDPKCRMIMALPYRDRIVQWAVYDILKPFYDKMFIEDSYACRDDKGALKAAKRLQYWMRKADRKPEKWYYLKLDISKYFYRVDHKILLSILRRRIKDDRLFFLLEKIIDNRGAKFGLPRGKSPDQCTPDEWESEVGMPIGNLTSQLFANVYLNELDQFCKHVLHIHCYVRYVDDIIILHNNKEELHKIKNQIGLFLNEFLHLELNRKTAIRPINMGIHFVGYNIYATHMKLRKPSARRILRGYSHICGQLADKEILPDKFERIEASYAGIIQHCNCYGLAQKLDKIYDTKVILKGDIQNGRRIRVTKRAC